MTNANALPGMEHLTPKPASPGDGCVSHQGPEPVRLNSPQRSQVQMRCFSLEELLPPDHPARTAWEVAETLDLSAFVAPIRAREHTAGRTAIDPRLLVALWLYASMDNVASGRKLAELCESHAAYQWLCGGVSVSYHTLNDFRVGHGRALDDLFTQVLGRLMHAGLVKIHRISQDGMRVRASAGSASFKRREKLDKCMQEAKAHLADLERLRDESPAQASQRAEASRTAAALGRMRRVSEAIAACQQVEAQRQQRQSNRKKREAPSVGSTTDPDARRMKMADGGFRPAYNVQIASDPESRVILAVEATNCGGDALLLGPMRDEVMRRTSRYPAEQLADGGYVSLDNVDQAAEEQVKLFMPVPEAQKEGQDRFEPRPRDSEAVAQLAKAHGPEGLTIHLPAAYENE